MLSTFLGACKENAPGGSRISLSNQQAACACGPAAAAQAPGNPGATWTRATSATCRRPRRFELRATAVLATTPEGLVTRATVSVCGYGPGRSFPSRQQARPLRSTPARDTERSRRPRPGRSQTRTRCAAAARLRAVTTIRYLSTRPRSVKFARVDLRMAQAHADRGRLARMERAEGAAHHCPHGASARSCRPRVHRLWGSRE
jgi:hypothetical protein